MTAPQPADFRADCPCGAKLVLWRAPLNTTRAEPHCRACQPLPVTEHYPAVRLAPVTLSPPSSHKAHHGTQPREFG